MARFARWVFGIYPNSWVDQATLPLAKRCADVLTPQVVETLNWLTASHFGFVVLVELHLGFAAH